MGNVKCGSGLSLKKKEFQNHPGLKQSLSSYWQERRLDLRANWKFLTLHTPIGFLFGFNNFSKQCRLRYKQEALLITNP